MKKIVFCSKIVLGAGLLLFGLNSCKNETKQEETPMTVEEVNAPPVENEEVENDTQYLEEAVAIGSYEMALGKLALQKGLSKEVRDYGKMLVADNTKSMEEAKALSNKITVTMPDENAEMNNENYNKLKAQSGMDFDKLFVEVIVQEQEKALDKMTEISQKAKDNDLQLWASRQVIGLTTHYEQAKKIQ
ncbi:DUF4142 domain-containing protein [Flavobacterium sp. UMI-01]|uniref:DUF4142 domain-containing protein n=1 Tax=Flavobacterium sp. UMI-01 TaxID=1441053 RepID=UPI001C7E018D|nr:DUF4142 domain-containing protein [Flavobacterium sp. UMI-01]GIZ10198.1 hypothetical protein FUMI01_29240 [Flavobacterium sp. UMI-01]